MVRLKAAAAAVGTDPDEFQFQRGSIKGLPIHTKRPFFSLFQFQRGSIKGGVGVTPSIWMPQSFQFQRGSIKGGISIPNVGYL